MALSVPKPYSALVNLYLRGMNSYGRIAAALDFCAAENASSRNCASVALSCPGACARSLGFRTGVQVKVNLRGRECVLEGLLGRGVVLPGCLRACCSSPSWPNSPRRPQLGQALTCRD